MEYRQITVADQRSPVHCLWQLRGNSVDPQRIVTDARCELITHLATPFHELREDKWTVQPSSIVCGQITGPLLLRSAGETNTIGIRLRSWAVGAALNITAHLLTDQILEARTVAGHLCDSIKETLHQADDSLQAIVLALLDKSSKCLEEKAVAAVSRAERDDGQCTVDDLAREAGVGARQLDRLMLANVGVTPKLFLRMLRFRKAIALHDRQQSWAHIAADCGYHDQSHMVREFKQFAGQSPTITVSQQSDLAIHFIQS
jgi:AraC-like DNA-binding protein